MRLERWAVLLLLLIPVFLLGDALWPGNVPVTWDTATQLPWRATATPEEQLGPRWNEDAVRENLAYRVFIHDTLRKGEIPWWSPYTYGGIPFVALSHVEVLYPPTWGVLLLDPYTAYGALLAFHLAMAGLGMWLFLRLAGLRTEAALVGAIVFMLNGMFASRTGHPQFVATGCWLPWVCWGIELSARGHRRQGVLATALATALCITAGHPSVYVYGFYFVGGYLLLRALVLEQTSWAQRIESVSTFAMGFALGIALASPQLLATLELSQFSDRTEGGLSAMTGRLSHWLHLVRAVFPNVTGSHRYEDYWSVSSTSYTAGTLYAGVAPLLLAFVGATRTRARGWTMAGYLAFAVAIMFVPIVFQACWYVLPGFRFSRVDRLSVFWFLGIAWLCAQGVQWLYDREPDGKGVSAIAGGAVPWVSVGLGVTLFTAYAVPRVAAWYARGAAKHATLADITPTLLWGLLLWGLASVWIGAVPHVRRRGAMTVALVALVLLDLGWFTRHHTIVREADRIFRPTAATDFLQADPEPFRVAKLGGRNPTGEPTWTILPANTGLAYGIEDLEGFGPLHDRNIDVLLDPLEPGRGSSGWHVRPFTNPYALLSPTLDVARVKYVLTTFNLPLSGFDLVHEGDLLIYENKDVLPLARFVTAHVVHSTQQVASLLLHQGGYDPRTTVSLLEEPPGWTDATPTGPNTVEVVHRGLNEVVLRKRGPDRGFVVLSDPYYPGWQAEVDGLPSPVYRADTAFRATVVPAGDHEVRFVFWPTWWRLGWGGTATSLLVLLGIVAAELVSRRRTGSGSEPLL